ncbi:hypothetical protein SD71_04865 [Cohnella kolymensis]|uniref:Uncharacterized protein n=1 Tax=Cohnella kolymensis TaxID=1590652 RepID=A0ABR5A860_9BACL|nr:hypothetical protein [Cohnella kolymensis]KIL37013.1 hypothetical protein SD71_04865 [Cohnella kolymensis]
MHKTAKIALRILLTSLLVIIAACGSNTSKQSITSEAKPTSSEATTSSAPANEAKSRPTTLAELAAYEGPDRMQILMEGAKKRKGINSIYFFAY